MLNKSRDLRQCFIRKCKKKKKSHSVLEIKNTEQQIIFMTSGESTDNQKQQTNEKDRSLLDLYLYVKLS